jgi:NAD(P)-dependent dehydrogenase (short-subunit alcohol dehydrogenase family)
VEAVVADGGKARFIAADLASFEDIGRLAEAASDVDVLVNNAGVSRGGPEQTAEEVFAVTFDVNVKAPFFRTCAIAPRMAAKGGGSIINISSMAATIGMNGLAAYGASKAALESLTKAWTAEYAAQGVRINTVTPGPTRTPRSRGDGREVRGLRVEHTGRPRRNARGDRQRCQLPRFGAGELHLRRDPASRRRPRSRVRAERTETLTVNQAST